MKISAAIAALSALCCSLALAGSAGAAGSGTFKVSASGKQSLSWSLDGTHGNCEIRRGSGSGSVGFSFKSPKSTPLYVDRSSGIVGSLTVAAKGDQTGSFSDTLAAPCSGYEPNGPYTADASGCGARSFDVRMDFKTKGAFTWVAGPAQRLPGGACPSYTDQLFSTDLTACGDSNTQYKRSWGLAYGGIGMFSSKLGISMKTLLKTKKGKSRTITGKRVVDCKPASTYSNPITLTGELKYSLKFKRVS